MKRILVAVCLLFMSAVLMAASTTSIAVNFTKVYDGDTVDVTYDALPVPLNKLRIRLANINAPELGAKASCDAENTAAINAREFLTSLLGSQKVIIVYGAKWDKYGGRVLGKLKLPDGRDIGTLLIEKGYAIPYTGVAGATAAAFCK